MGEDVVRDGQKTSASHIVFRVVLAGIGVLTVLGTSHAVRYVLCGVLVAILVGESLWSRRQKRSTGKEQRPRNSVL
jgi:hypothetical protein